MDKQDLMVGMGRSGTPYGPQQQKKSQTVIVSLPSEVKRYLSLMTNFNSLVWIIVGLTFWLMDEGDKMPGWAQIVMGIAVFICVFLIPVFINFINKVPWGQEGK